MSGEEASNPSNHEESIRIHIDEHPYQSPNPTASETLYVLGNVKPGLELFRELTGAEEDQPVPRTKELIHLTKDEHFHSGEAHHREFSIIVNGQKKPVRTRRVSFEQAVKLAFNPVPPESIFTVTYFNAAHNKEGSLKIGQKVKIKPEGTVFSVTETGQS